MAVESVEQPAIREEWANEACRNCPACKPPHERPIDCSCAFCEPWGHTNYSAKGRTHFCGTIRVEGMLR